MYLVSNHCLANFSLGCKENIIIYAAALQQSMSTNSFAQNMIATNRMYCRDREQPWATCVLPPRPRATRSTAALRGAPTHTGARVYDPSLDLSLYREARDDIMIHPILTSPTCPGRPGRRPGRSRGSGCGEERPWSSRRRTQAGGNTRWVWSVAAEPGASHTVEERS